MAPEMDDKDIERMIDIIGDGELSAEAQAAPGRPVAAL